MRAPFDGPDELHIVLARNVVKKVFRVMARLVPAIHAFTAAKQGMDARHKAGHDVERMALLA
jgi:hypothetical protein